VTRARPARLLIALGLAMAALGAHGGQASAAGVPTIASTWVQEVNATSADLHVKINPNGLSTKYLFEYISDAALQANRAAGREDFAGALKKPQSPTGIGSSTSFEEPAPQHISGLASITTYHYRAVATNSAGTTVGPERALATEEATNAFNLPDGRGWEMVSPVEKNGGAIKGPGGSFGGGVFQSALQGGLLTYTTTSSFSDPQGNPGASQYLSARGATGWSTTNITQPLSSGSYGDEPEGAPYQLFSADLSRALLLDPRRCEDGKACPSSYSLRASATGSLASSPQAPDLRFVGTGPDLAHLVLASCAALTADAIEVAGAEGCDSAETNLYEWSGGSLRLVNLLAGQTTGTPGAALAAQSGAVSTDGSRVYWTVNDNLYLREGTLTKQVDEAQGGGGTFQTASTNGSVAFFTKGGTLYRFVAASQASEPIASEVLGVLGASADGSSVYYAATAGLELWREGTTTEIAPGPEAVTSGDYPPATGTARVSSDGSHLIFLSTAELTGYENAGLPEVFLYGPPAGGGAATLTCVSCNPTGERPKGDSSIPGAIANGATPAATRTYKPRAMTADGSRVFFDSADTLARADTNQSSDVYEWEGAGVGGCPRLGGCIGLLSSGRSPEPSNFIDASADGADVFFLTESSLVIPTDPGSYDLYDAREGGGFPVSPTPIPCNGDACQSLPAAPEDPTPGTLVPNSGNPASHFPKEREKKHKKKHKKKHHHKKPTHNKAQGNKRGPQ
jgi:hypothetical protein